MTANTNSSASPAPSDSRAWTPPQLPGFEPWRDVTPDSTLPPEQHRWTTDSLATLAHAPHISRYHAILEYYGPGTRREHGAAIGGNNLWAGYATPEAALFHAMAGFVRRVKGATPQETRTARRAWRLAMEKIDPNRKVPHESV